MQNAFAISGALWFVLALLCFVLPLLIHLIQLYRHQKVRWAAMSFLLRSQQRSRRWLRLKQWLLIATRITLLLFGLIAISQIRCDRSDLSDYFGDGTVTEHLILLDDSYSMEESLSTGTPKSNAARAIVQLMEQLESLPNQRVSLITFSQAHLWETDPEVGLGTNKDNAAEQEKQFLVVQRQVVTDDLVADLEVVLQAMPSSLGSTGPQAAMQWARVHAMQDRETSFVVHVLSDFRSHQWEPTSGVWSASATASIDQISFVDCGEDTAETSPNLSLINLKQVGVLNTTSTGFLFECTIKNQGKTDATNVVANVEVWQNATDVNRMTIGSQERLPVASSEDWQGSELPSILFERIPAGETVVQQFSLSFAQAGMPVIRLTLPEDKLPGDNQRQLVVEAAESLSVLVVDDAVSQGSWYLQQSLNPAGLTGVQCQLEASTVLRRSSAAELKNFKWIALVDVPRLDEAALDTLREYLEHGGGLLWFAGSKVNLDYYNGPLYSSGLFPVRLDRTVPTPERIEGELSDLQVVSHPIFTPFITGDESQLDAVIFRRLWKVATDTIEDSSVGNVVDKEVLARFRGKQQWPLLLEHRLRQDTDIGETESASVYETDGGRILTFLNTIDGQWNNWPQELTFPAAIMLMADYVARPHLVRDFSVGNYGVPLDFQWQTADAVITRLPNDSQSIPESKDLTLKQSTDNVPGKLLASMMEISSRSMQVTARDSSRVNRLATVNEPLTVIDWNLYHQGNSQWQRQLSQPDLDESHLARVDLQSLETFDTKRYQWVNWNQLLWQTQSLAKQAWLRPMVLGIILMLVLEAFLAWWAGGSS